MTHLKLLINNAKQKQLQQEIVRGGPIFKYLLFIQVKRNSSNNINDQEGAAPNNQKIAGKLPEPNYLKQ